MFVGKLFIIRTKHTFIKLFCIVMVHGIRPTRIAVHECQQIERYLVLIPIILIENPDAHVYSLVSKQIMQRINTFGLACV